MNASVSHVKPNRLSLLALCGLLAGPFLSMVDSNIVNVALPDIATQLHTTLGAAQWVISGYLLALAAGLAASAYLAKRFGTRRIYLASLIGFTAASAACALAPTIGWLIALRAVQGFLGAPLVPLAMNMILGGNQTQREEMAQGFPPAAGILLFLAPALGPTAGGLLIHLAGWPLIFLINVPLGVLGALGALGTPADPPHRRAAIAFDPLGLVLLGAGLVLSTYGATEGPQQGWGSTSVWPFVAGGGTLLLLYVLWALRRRHPAVDLKLLRHSQTALAVGLCALAAVIMFSVLVLVPVFMEQLQGMSALTAGLALLPQGLVMGLGIGAGDRLARKWGVRTSVLLGMALLALTTASLLALTLATPAWLTALLLSGRGLAVGLVIQPLLMAMLAGLAPSEVPDGNTLFNVAERLGGSVGIALLTTFLTSRIATHVNSVLAPLGIPPTSLQQASEAPANLPPAIAAQLGQAAVAGFHDTIWLLVALSALGCLAALLLRRRQETVSRAGDAMEAAGSAPVPAEAGPVATGLAQTAMR
jgi:EmrB/QacA subfamily drug resistance transporter